jgi:hypothetical protein
VKAHLLVAAVWGANSQRLCSDGIDPENNLPGAVRAIRLLYIKLWFSAGVRAAALHAIRYAQHLSRSHDAVIRVYSGSGNVIETHEQKGDFKEW